MNIYVLIVAMIGTASCGSGCYYGGKGILQVPGTVDDVAAALARAERERSYQERQVRLQQLKEELRSLDLDDMERRYRAALMSNDGWTISSMKSEMRLWKMKTETAEDLEEDVADYQEERQRRLERGPRRSFSRIIDENCE